MNQKIRSNRTKEKNKNLFNGCEVIRNICILMLLLGHCMTTGATHTWRFLRTHRSAAAIAAAAGVAGCSSWYWTAAVAASLEEWHNASHNMDPPPHRLSIYRQKYRGVGSYIEWIWWVCWLKEPEKETQVVRGREVSEYLKVGYGFWATEGEKVYDPLLFLLVVLIFDYSLIIRVLITKQRRSVRWL